VVNDAEVGHGIVGLGGDGYGGHVTHPDTASSPGAAVACSPRHHARIQVEGVHPIGLEDVENQLGPDPAAAADL
jgi:hypothetical protein